MDKQTQIINYLNKVSGGRVNITSKIADDIMAIVTSIDVGKAYVKLHSFNGQHKRWDIVQTIETTEAEINLQIKAALQRQQVTECYMFECFNAQGQSEGKIFTINPFLFD